MKTLAVIAARGGSKRLPGKNVRPFLGVPLLHWSIHFSRRVRQFDQVVISTDSDIIAECAKFAELDAIGRRPVELGSDEASSVDVVLDALDRAEQGGERFDLVALLQPTSPVRELVRWERAFELLLDSRCAAVIGVSPVRDHPFHVFKLGENGHVLPWGTPEGLAERSQDLPAAVVVNGGLYLIKSDELRRGRSFFPRTTMGVICDGPCEQIDIDTEADWVAGEALARHFHKSP